MIITSQATLRVRSGFALIHLLVATESARTAHQAEPADKDTPLGPWYDKMMRSVPVSIVMAGAALEAQANEILQDILDSPARFGITSSREKLLSELKEDRSGNAPQKFLRLALLMEKDPDTGTEPWHNIKLLVKFRNEFMHFRPSWDDDNIHSGGFVDEMERKVPVINNYKGGLFFPYGFMTYGCAKWAVQTVLTFSQEYAKLLGIRDKLASAIADSGLP
jgi:hypothetical protein